MNPPNASSATNAFAVARLLFYLPWVLHAGCSAGRDDDALAERTSAVVVAPTSLKLNILTNSCGANQVQDFFQVVNTGTTALKLSDIKIKLWADDTTARKLVPHVSNGGCITNVSANPSCVHQATGVTASATTFAPACGSDANHAGNWEIELSTTDDSLLVPGASWTNIQSALNLEDFSNFTPGTGRWYSPCLPGSSYVADPRFGLYYQGALVSSQPVAAGDCRLPRLSTNRCGTGGQCALTIRWPRGLPDDRARFVGQGSVDLGSLSKVVFDDSAPGTVASVAETVHLRAGVASGSVLSVGPVILDAGALVRGDLLTNDLVSLAAGAAVTGVINRSADLLPLVARTWVVSPPPTVDHRPQLDCAGTLALPPGSYDPLTLRSGCKVTLKTGVYFFRSLSAQLGSVLMLDQTSGPIYVYVFDSVAYQGSIQAVGGARPAFLLGYLGALTVDLKTRFDGTLVAPQAPLIFEGAEHHGAFYARHMETRGNVKVVLEASLVPQVGTATVGDCARQLTADATLPEPLRTQQANLDLMTLCLAPGLAPCEARLVATANADRHALALQYVSKTIGPADHLAVTRDITRKVHRMQHDAALLAQWCTGDADGDRVPDAVDHCANTPPLTPTDDVGCPVTARPIAAPRVVIDGLLGRMGILYNPHCNGAPIPTSPEVRARNIAIGPFINIGGYGFLSTIALTAAVNQPAGCDVWYEIQVFDPLRARTYDMVFDAHEGFAGDQPGVVNFKPGFNDPSSRAQFRRDELNRITVQRKLSYSARVMNGNGLQTPWTTPIMLWATDSIP